MISISAWLPRTLALMTLITAQALGAAYAGDNSTNVGENGLAIKGYDPVAYFNASAAQAGSPEHTVEWNGATWQFATAANKRAFAANPAKYAPQYGGYCAIGTRMGLKNRRTA